MAIDAEFVGLVATFLGVYLVGVIVGVCFVIGGSRHDDSA